MFRLAQTNRVWFDASIPHEGEIVPVPVLFERLPADVASREKARLAEAEKVALFAAIDGIVAAMGGGESAQSIAEARQAARQGLDLVTEALSEETLTYQRGLLERHVCDWEIEDEEGQRLPVNESTLANILGRANWLKPLWAALVNASSAAGLKKTASTGSAGSSTTGKDQPPG